jgi:hypothetical protein
MNPIGRKANSLTVCGAAVASPAMLIPDLAAPMPLRLFGQFDVEAIPLDFLDRCEFAEVSPVGCMPESLTERTGVYIQHMSAESS